MLKSAGSYQYSESLPSYKYWRKDTGEEMAKWCIWEMAHLSTAWNIISSCQISSHLIKIIATFIAIINSVIFTGTITGLHLREPALAPHGSDFWIRSNVNHCTWGNHSQPRLTVITIFTALMLLTFCSPAWIVYPSSMSGRRPCSVSEYGHLLVRLPKWMEILYKGKWEVQIWFWLELSKWHVLNHLITTVKLRCNERARELFGKSTKHV